MIVFTFQERFWTAVRTGAKTQTIRKTRKRLPCVGDTVSLRAWIGAPYRSKQTHLRPDSELTGVLPITIALRGMGSVPRLWVDHSYLDEGEEREALACADGFESFDEMLPFFVTAKQPNFNGHLYLWEP